MPDGFQTAVITFVLNYAAYFAEIYRSGIQSIDAVSYTHLRAKQLALSITGPETPK